MINNSTDLRVIKTRQNIKNSVLKLMEEKPVSEITITEISDRALINRKTFYRHFESVNDVINDIEMDILDTLVSLLSRNNSSCLEIGVVLRYMGITIEVNKDTLSKMIKFSSEYLYSSKLYEVLLKTTEVALKNVIKTKEKNRIQMISLYVVTGVLSVYYEWLEKGCSQSVDEVVETTRRLTYGSLAQFIPDEQLKNMDLY